MMSALASKIDVVTGATGQVGWGIAHAALDTGATVVLPVRSEAARKKVERDFGKARTSIVTVGTAQQNRASCELEGGATWAFGRG